MEILHNEERRKFYVEIEGHMAYVDYILVDGGLDIRHTVVPQEIGGRGIAGQLVKAAYDYAQANGLKSIATCSYAVRWLENHPEYKGSCGCDYAGEGTCAL